MNLATHVTEHAGCVVVVVEGELDLSTADQLNETLDSAIASGTGPIVLDLQALRFCDSAGLAVLVKTHNLLGGEGRRLVIASPSTAVSRVLELSGLDQVIATATTPDDACAIASQP
jgi:anti-sigma B factor antagonist